MCSYAWIEFAHEEVAEVLSAHHSRFVSHSAIALSLDLYITGCHTSNRCSQLSRSPGPFSQSLHVLSVVVLQVVAKVMQGYLLYGKVLSSRVVPASELHENVFKGANRKFKLTAWRKMARERFNVVSGTSCWLLIDRHWVSQPTEDSEKKAKNAHKKKSAQKSKKKKMQSKLEVRAPYDLKS